MTDHRKSKRPSTTSLWDSPPEPEPDATPRTPRTTTPGSELPSPRAADPAGAPSSPAATTELLAPGSHFGVYVVGPCIGQGGMARIYRAQHEGLRRQVALKVMVDGFSHADGRERFLREARIAAVIKHPNVVNIFDVGVENGIPFMAMELLEGEDLEAVLERGALLEDALIDVMVPVVAGLAAVHDAGVVHRDLKPGNIFLARGRHGDVEPKLLDFGISKSSCTKQFRLTDKSNARLMGTPFYMPPEAVHGKEMTARSDQYSLGVLMYECITGQNPFLADSMPEVVQRITTGTYVPVSEHGVRVSKRLARIIERAMSVDPEERYSDARELGRDMLALAGARTRITWGLTFTEVASRTPKPHPSSAPAGLGPPPQPPPAPRRRYRPGALAVAALALLLGGFLVLRNAEPGASSSIEPPSARPGEVDVVRSGLRPVAPPNEPAPDSEASVANATPPAIDTDATGLDGETEATSDSGNAAPPSIPVVKRSVARAKPRPRRKPRRRRRVSRPRPAPAPGNTLAASSAEAEWAVGLQRPSASNQRLDLGTNNSPILD